MYCAVCDQGERVIAAIAVCQRCGGGVCRTHLHTFSHPAAPGGMLGLGPPRRECVCQLCVKADVAQRPSVQGTALPAALPDAETLIQMVEALLHDKAQKRHSGSAPSWQKKWQTLIRRVLPGLVARKVH